MCTQSGLGSRAVLILAKCPFVDDPIITGRREDAWCDEAFEYEPLKSV